MSATLRLITLFALARLRSAGWAPWLLVSGWLVIASYQEPLMFRQYGIYLVDDAAWTGGFVVLVVLLFAQRRLPKRCAIATNLTMLVAMAVLQGVGGYLADQSPSLAGFYMRGVGVVNFVLAWSPLAITVSRNKSSETKEELVRKLVVLASGVMGMMLSVALRTSADTIAYAASLFAVAGAVCWASGRSTSS